MNNNNSIFNRPPPSSSRYIKLQIQYGSEIYELLLSNKDKNILVEHLLNEIEKLTKVPKCHQSIIYKGQRLDHKPQANLDDLYIFNNSKLILTGTQKQFHDKYCCPNHEHHTIDNTPSKSYSLQQENKDRNEEKSIKDIYPNTFGFIPEPNKNYE